MISNVTNTTKLIVWLNLVLGRTQPSSLSQKRYQRIIQTAITAIGGKGLALVSTLIAVPLLLPHLGVERFGLWVIITTSALLISISDMGIGNGLMNSVSRAYAENRSDLARKAISNGLIVLVGIAGVLGVFCLLIGQQIDWISVLRLQSPTAKSEIIPALVIGVIAFLFALPLSIIPKILSGYQEGAVANTWLTISNLLVLISILVASISEFGMVVVLLLTQGIPVLISAIAAIWLFAKHKPELMPSARLLDRREMKSLFATGGLFLIIQLSALIIFQKDSLIIAFYLGANQVALYSTAWRLFLLTTFVPSLLFAAIWPAYTEAYSRQDHKWIKRTFINTSLLSLAATLLLVGFFVIYGRDLIVFWSRSTLVVPLNMLMALGIWSVISVWMNSLSCFLGGIGRITVQAVCSVLIAMSSIVLSALWIRDNGSVAVVYATIASYALLGVVPMTYQASRILLVHR